MFFGEKCLLIYYQKNYSQGWKLFISFILITALSGLIDNCPVDQLGWVLRYISY